MRAGHGRRVACSLARHTVAPVQPPGNPPLGGRSSRSVRRVLGRLSVSARVEKRLKQDLSSQGVAKLSAAGGADAGLLKGLVRLECGQTLVPQLDGQRGLAAELVGQRAGQAGLRAVRAIHVERQADHQAAGFVLGAPVEDAAGVLGEVAGRGQQAGRGGQAPPGVGEGQAGPTGAVVDADPASDNGGSPGSASKLNGDGKQRAARGRKIMHLPIAIHRPRGKNVGLASLRMVDGKARRTGTLC